MQTQPFLPSRTLVGFAVLAFAQPVLRAATASDVEAALGLGTGVYLDGGSDGNERLGLSSLWTSLSSWTTESDGVFGEDRSDSNLSVEGDLLDAHHNAPDQSRITVRFSGLVPETDYEVHVTHLTGTSPGENGFLAGDTPTTLTLYRESTHPGTLIEQDGDGTQLRGVLVGTLTANDSGEAVLVLDDVNGEDGVDRSQIDGVLLESVSDRDNDGLSDASEIAGTLNAYTDGVRSGPPGDPTDPEDPDSDDDGIPDGEEVMGGDDGYVTDPNAADSDLDAIPDPDELAGTRNPWSGGLFGSPPGEPTDPSNADSDRDGVDDLEEMEAGADGFLTDPNRPDTDGDGFADGTELARGTDPTDDQSFPEGGSGLPNLAFPGRQTYDVLSLINADTGTPRGHGFVTMHRGYLFVVFANDGGGGDASGFAFLDISDPENPVPVFTTEGDVTTDDGTPAYSSPASPHFAGNIREAHGYTFSGDIWCMTMNNPTRGSAGLQFWDLSDPLHPLRLSEIELSSLTGGDYSPSAWWVSWQGRYAYAASTTGGLHIVDAADPANPVEVKRIPTGSLGGFRVNTCFAIGNLLVIAAADAGGISTFDISDPVNPLLLDTTNDQVGYSMMVNGHRILGAHDPARIYDISDPTDITHEFTGPNVADKGGYGTFKDGEFYYGSSTHSLRLDLESQQVVAISNLSAAGISDADWDFSVALGNLIFAGNDHSGSALVVGDPQPDLMGPEVNMVVPGDDSTDVAPSSRIGLTFTDQLLTESIDSATVTIRPIGGEALAGRFTNQTGIVNFTPDEPLLADTTYEIVLEADGVRDLAGNGLASGFVSRFSTGSSVLQPTVAATSSGASPVGTAVTFEAIASDATAPTFSWDFGDGTVTEFTPSPTSSHSYSSPGNYTVVVTMQDGGNRASATIEQVVHHPLATAAAVHSSTIAFDPSGDRVWNVNPDNDTLSAIDATGLSRVLEVPTGDHPRSVALAGGEVWVTNQDDSSITIHGQTDGGLIETLPLGHGARPFGISFDPTGSSAYVTLQGKGELLRLDRATRAITARLHLAPDLRGIAITGDGSRALVTRFRSADQHAEVHDIDLASFVPNGVIPLAIDPGPDAEDSGRGLPNYLTTIGISPDGTSAWIPSKKDNIDRGLSRDGQDLTFESTVRSIVSKIDLSSGTEDLAARLDFNDRDLASAVAFSRLGNYVFVATQGTNTVEIVDAYTSEHFGSILSEGRAPQGLAVSPDGSRLFVHNFLSRSVTVFAIEHLCSGLCGITPKLADISTVGNEALAPEVLAGKQVFYNADDARMNHDKYISCASCHLDGDTDCRVWDFTGRGEGLRNTTDLRGRAGLAHGRVHWSANFDEIQDFEHDIRGPFGGSGFMADGDFHAGTRDTPLGDAKAGISAELDQLASYVSSLATVPDSPHRNPDGSMTDSAQAGELIFAERCAACHGGPGFNDSLDHVLHDVGTLGPDSGERLGATLYGIDTPGLRGAWDGAPYLHDGSAETLRDVLTTRNPGDLHGITSDLGATELQQLEDYLLQLDDSNDAFSAPTGNPSITSPSDGALVAVGGTTTLRLDTGLTNISKVEFLVGDTVLFTDFAAPYEFDWSGFPIDPQEIYARVHHAGGVISTPLAVLVTGEDGGGLNVSTPLPFASEAGPVAGNFRISRSGDTSGDLSVSFQLTGSATEGSDYPSVGGTLVIPDGQASVDLVITPFADELAEGAETVTLTLEAGGYPIGTSSNATLEIHDDAAQQWSFQHFGTDSAIPGIGLAQDNPDGDRWTNFHEYALLGDPWGATADPSQPTRMELDGAAWETSYRVRADDPDLWFDAEVSGDLDQWEPFTGTTYVEHHGDGTMTLSFRASLTTPSRFLRLRIDR